MHNCVFLSTDGTYEFKLLDHEKLEDILGKITFVGAISECEAFAVGSLNSSREKINPFCKNEKYFEKNVRGNVILVGSNKMGEAMDLDCETVTSFMTSIAK